MSDVQVQPDWWVASNGRWYPPIEEAPRPGWWVASDGKWYPPKKAKRTKEAPVVPSTATVQLPPIAATTTLPLTGTYESVRLALKHPPARRPWGLAVLIMIGGALMAVGGFLPWGTATIGIFSISVDGTYDWGDGWIALGIGVVLILAGAALWGLRGLFWRVLPVVLAAAGVALAIYEVVHITNVSREVQRGSKGVDAQLNVAYGLIIVAVGAAAGLVGGIGALTTWSRWAAVDPAE